MGPLALLQAESGHNSQNQFHLKRSRRPIEDF